MRLRAGIFLMLAAAAPVIASAAPVSTGLPAGSTSVSKRASFGLPVAAAAPPPHAGTQHQRGKGTGKQG